MKELTENPVARQQCQRQRLKQAALILFLLALLHGCAAPVTQLRTLATDNRFVETEVKAGGYSLTVFQNENAGRDNSGVLNVYLEGDGSPWMFRTIVMKDPTPRSPLMLSLMSLDTSAAMYLGRPCYNGHANDDGCESGLWTFGRYSATVIDSMASAVRALAKRQKATDIRLFGHSGGGALAMLLAANLPDVSRIVTLAGNLDTDAWTRHHRYTPLFSSLNPARQQPLPESVSQWHFVGTADGVIPPELVREFIMQQPQAEGYALTGFTHGCCWASVWPDILKNLEGDSAVAMPGVQFKSKARITDASGNQ